MIIELVPVSGIVIDHRLRRLDTAKVNDMVASIQRIGLRTPITVRIVSERLDDHGVIHHEVPVLIAGLHRLEAARILGWDDIPSVVSDGTEIDAKMWEIAENLHRADLTVLERSEHVAEWIKLADEKPAQIAPVYAKGGRGNTGGINAAVRDLGIERTEAQRAVKINNIPDEVKEAAKEAGIDDSQTALMWVASLKSAEAQLKAIKQKKNHDEAQKRNRDTDKQIALNNAEEFAERLYDRFGSKKISSIISYLECCKPKQVVAALRRLAA